ncbi:MAG TPA: hypothetical protein VLF14_12705 [Candidatus Binatia bacterium]|nr:hypothetical protein [Candidatus Binatia bacterium]
MKLRPGASASSCHFEAFSFESVRIDGVTYEHDELREAHRLFLEIGAPIRAHQVAKKLAE